MVLLAKIIATLLGLVCTAALLPILISLDDGSKISLSFYFVGGICLYLLISNILFIINKKIGWWLLAIAMPILFVVGLVNSYKLFLQPILATTTYYTILFMVLVAILTTLIFLSSIRKHFKINVK